MMEMTAQDHLPYYKMLNRSELWAFYLVSAVCKEWRTFYVAELHPFPILRPYTFFRTLKISVFQHFHRNPRLEKFICTRQAVKERKVSIMYLARLLLISGHLPPVLTEDWRCDKYRWFNQGVCKLPRKNPELRKLYFVADTVSGPCSGRL